MSPNLNKLSAIIVEDEELSRETLRNYLVKYCSNVTIVAEAANIMQAKEAIERHNPNVVFLDVEMPFGNAFDLLEQLENITFETVFVTAFSNYAIQALNLSASYYLLKPVDIDELVKAVEKISLSVSEKKEINHTKILIDNIKIENKQLQKIVLPLMDGFEVVQVNQIIRCEAYDNFTTLFLTDKRKLVICRTLKYYEGILNDFDFIRVHKSNLINLQHVKQYKKGKTGQVIMSDGAYVDISPNRRQEFINKF